MHDSSMQSPVKEELHRMTRVLIVIATLLIGGLSGRADEPAAPAWQSLAWRRIAASPLARTEAGSRSRRSGCIKPIPLTADAYVAEIPK